MSLARIKAMGLVLGLVMLGGLFGALFTSYGGFASASPAQQAVTGTQPQNSGTTADKPADTDSRPNRADIEHYATIFEQNFALQLGVDQSKIDPALRAAFTATIDQAVADGKLSADMANAIKSKIDNMSFSDLTSIPLGMAGKVDDKDNLGDNKTFLDATDAALNAGAQALGITRSDFEKAMSDNTLKGLVTSKGLTIEGFESTVENALKASLDQAVADGALTQQQSDLCYNAFKGKFEMVLSGLTEMK